MKLNQTFQATPSKKFAAEDDAYMSEKGPKRKNQTFYGTMTSMKTADDSITLDYRITDLSKWQRVITARIN
jgi:hypothetical protein